MAYERRRGEVEQIRGMFEGLRRGGGGGIGSVGEAQVRIFYHKAMWHAEKLRDISRKLVLSVDPLPAGVALAIDVKRFLETGCGFLRA